MTEGPREFGSGSWQPRTVRSAVCALLRAVGPVARYASAFYVAYAYGGFISKVCCYTVVISIPHVQPADLILSIFFPGAMWQRSNKLPYLIHSACPKRQLIHAPPHCMYTHIHTPGRWAQHVPHLYGPC
jgi:hypothetical protein